MNKAASCLPHGLLQAVHFPKRFYHFLKPKRWAGFRYCCTFYHNSIRFVKKAELDLVKEADLVIGGVLVTGAKAPKLVTQETVSKMKKGSVIIDAAVDQGGCIETCSPTNHENPTFVVDDVVHYCVTNMPGAVARTSTFVLTNATFPYVLKIANFGYREAMERDPALMKGLNVHFGKLVCKPVADSQKVECAPIEFQ